MENYVIIVAGGKGLRMGTDIPKQFLPIGGLPVLMHTIKTFKNYDNNMNVILVLPEHQQEYWRELCNKYSFDENIEIANGGETRFHSVKNGLALIPDETKGVVGVHDGVRPFVSEETIHRTYQEARKTGAAVPVIPVVDTLRHLFKQEKPNDTHETDKETLQETDEKIHSETVQRDEYRIVQTPQAFDIQLLKEAYKQEYCKDFTDDASVVEHYGHEVALVEGNNENIKITKPFDLAIAKVIINND